jgi:HEPN domain-containing protein
MRRQFQRLAELRAGEALVLVQNRKEQGAYYLAGYAVECALKACIAKLTKRNEFPLKPEYVRKTYTHDLSELLRLAGLEKQLEIDMSLNTALAITWTIVKGWNEEKRYVPTGLKGKNMYAALMGPDGVLTWIKQRW